MYIEFIDLLRCTAEHDESQLVAVLDRMDGRDVIEAKLGCPVCGAHFFIQDGVAVFGDVTLGAPLIDTGGMFAFRISALLSLRDPGKTVLLVGRLANVSASIAEDFGARVISLNSPSPTQMVDRVAEIRAASRLPVASRSLDGIAVDSSHATPLFLGEAARILRPGGRLYVVGRTNLPPQFTIVAVEGEELLAEVAGELVNLKPRS